MEIESFFYWFKKHDEYYQKTWLILGKGPSYSKIDEYDTSSFMKISLNHVVREQKVEIAHVIDFDAAYDCADKIYDNARILVMPWRPHVKNWVGIKTLEDLLDEHPTLKKLKQEGRVKFYNLGSSPHAVDSSPIIPANYFSSEAVINLLTVLGIKNIKSLGVDGGSTYNQSFKDLEEKTLLSNGHANFDIQFRSISKNIIFKKLNYAPLGIDTPARVVVNFVSDSQIAKKVLEYSIRINTTIPVEVFFEQTGTKYFNANQTERNPKTYLKFVLDQCQQILSADLRRFLLIENVILLKLNLTNLWSMHLNDAEVLHYSTPSEQSTCNFFLFKFALDKNLDHYSFYQRTALELFGSSTHSITVSNPDLFPWVSIASTDSEDWIRTLQDAVSTEFISREELIREVLNNTIRPSVLVQMKRSKFRYLLKFIDAKHVDLFFDPSNLKSLPVSIIKTWINRALVKILILFF